MFSFLDSGTQYLLSKIVQFILELFLFLLIPFIWYLTQNRKLRGFLQYIGIKKVSVKTVIPAIKITGIAYTFTLLYFVYLKISGGMEISPLQEPFEISNTITFLWISVVYALNAGVCEEILFRGFIGKRCIGKWGFNRGNIVQSFIFVFPHLSTFGIQPTFEVILGIINAGVMGYAFGYIMEKKANGSIVPSIIVHIIVDLIAIPVSLFVL